MTMINYRTILFAADFSERTREAFHVACALARDSAVRLIVLHVAEPVLFTEPESHPGQAGFPQLFPSETPSHLKTLESDLRAFYIADPQRDVEYHIREGNAADEVARTAKALDADVIVMGTHGRTGLSRLLVGSVAESVMRRASCPVLALRFPDPVD
jgi:nucleotide-binding universal stress UspA family protein